MENQINRDYRVLELGKVLEMLAAKCSCADTADEALRIQPQTDINLVHEMLRDLPARPISPMPSEGRSRARCFPWGNCCGSPLSCGRYGRCAIGAAIARAFPPRWTDYL